MFSAAFALGVLAMAGGMVAHTRAVERPWPWLTVIGGGVVGAASGAGLAIGLGHQPTTANIDSGYSFASVAEWLVLAAFGGVPGSLVGLVVGFVVPRAKPVVAVFVVAALIGGVGWVVDGQRDVIDCDEDSSYCSDRYR